MNLVLEAVEGSCDLVYLFGNATVRQFYPRFGFVPVPENQFSVAVPTKAEVECLGQTRRLELANPDDVKLLRRLITERRPLSGILDVDRADMILAWHCIYGFPEDFYYLEVSALLVIAKVQGDTLLLYDIIGKRKPELASVIKALAPKGVHKVRLYFTPDFADIHPESQPYIDEDSTFFVKSTKLRLDGEYLYPYTAHA